MYIMFHGGGFVLNWGVSPGKHAARQTNRSAVHSHVLIMCVFVEVWVYLLLYLDQRMGSHYHQLALKIPTGGGGDFLKSYTHTHQDANLYTIHTYTSQIQLFQWTRDLLVDHRTASVNRLSNYHQHSNIMRAGLTYLIVHVFTHNTLYHWCWV